MCDIELGDIGDIDQSQCHNPCEGERKKPHVTLWLVNVTNVTNFMSPKCYPQYHGAYVNVETQNVGNKLTRLMYRL